MRRCRLLWIVTAYLALGIGGCNPANHSAAVVGTEVGNTAPDIDSVDADGKPLKLSDQRGKVVLLDFWATWCGPCRTTFPHSRELVSRMKARPFVLLGVSGDGSREDILRVQESGDVTWRSWWDGDIPNGQRDNITSIYRVGA